jgi:hypothetical protein
MASARPSNFTEQPTLCSEYEDCVAGRKYWRLSTGEEARDYRDQYAALVLELEAEIMAYLESAVKRPMLTDA